MSEIRDFSFGDLSVGMESELIWNVTENDIDTFASLSGDANPLHVDRAYARSRGFRDRVAHGFMLGGKVSAFVGTVMPGRRCLLLEETLAFPNPVFAGDRIAINGKILELWPDQELLRLKIRATKIEDEKSVIVGRGSLLCQIRS